MRVMVVVERVGTALADLEEKMRGRAEGRMGCSAETELKRGGEGRRRFLSGAACAWSPVVSCTGISSAWASPPPESFEIFTLPVGDGGVVSGLTGVACRREEFVEANQS